MKKQGIVYLVGAGPGDPGLMTVKGMECLRKAEVVVYDYLANDLFLAEAPDSAEFIYVGKKKGCHYRGQEEINQILLEKGLEGKTVVRLKGGDPYVFGRGGEEVKVLRDHDVPFEVIPGITAGFAAAAYAGIPVTHRGYTTSVALVTGHEHPGKRESDINWENLATGVGTIVFYMGVTNLPQITQNLIKHGRSPETAVALVRWATRPEQETIVGTLADIVEKVEKSTFKPPAVIIVGDVVNLREELCWFDKLPLFGKNILVTRTAKQAGSFSKMLSEQGARAISCPLIEVVPPESYKELDEEINRLSETDYLVLSSENAIEAFMTRLNSLGKDLRALAGVKIVTVGPKTASVLEARGLRPDLIPEEYRAEGIVELLLKAGVEGKRVLYPRAELARDLIPTKLAEAGAQVAAPVAYRTQAPEESAEDIRSLLQEGELDAVTFTSASTVNNLVSLLGDDTPELLKGVALISIGDLTSKAAEKHGLTITRVANTATLEEMVKTTVAYFSEQV